MYGFKGELELKYAAKEDVKAVYSLCKKVFALLPLAARIGSDHTGAAWRPVQETADREHQQRGEDPTARLPGCSCACKPQLYITHIRC